MDMDFEKFFSPKTIIPKLEAQSKQEVISSLVDLLKEESKITDREKVLSAVIERESVDSTGVGNGIALPHASIRGLNKIITAIARIPDGIDFVAQDRKPVFLVILICYPPTQNHVYLSLLSSVSKVFSKKENVQTIIKQTSAKAIHDKLLDLLLKQDEQNKLSHLEKKPDERVLITPPPSGPVPEILLLIRLQMIEEEFKVATRGKKQLQQKIDNLRSLISKDTLQHYDKLKERRPPAVVPIEGNTCHGCFMTLSTDFVQRVKQEKDNLFLCPLCRRFVYWI
ncbi:MAG TPA: PTS sugar transporter subunit IIA [Candidatus Hydrogenedens sp.]|nr:PTS sugar transporter subunit IIA [Candidatus Hydrogenedens sp.]HOK09519.1 PTS sugar transporter subunit IIA [Candidatus Hydrogenedens sp.]HOL18793.1 PTS sugar transporter subunit IIA [Candidatus Hydrogenedens sp.]HPP58382.1 PTS sugar transporter subunit IIA [Candidatus Hydrogenedens sp.]